MGSTDASTSSPQFRHIVVTRGWYSSQVIATRRALLLSVVCVGLYLVRVAYTGELRFLFLPYNLLLAWIPWGLSVWVSTASRRPAWLALLFVWLLFFPNSFYLITDLAHLGGRSAAPAWFDPALFAAYALVGAVLAVGSLGRVERKLADLVGGWALALLLAGVVVATGFGVWLGRVRRWNSWDLVLTPGDLVSEIGHVVLQPWHHPGAVAATMVYSCLLGATYLCFRREPDPAINRSSG